jgi:hypothetical protein
MQVLRIYLFTVRIQCMATTSNISVLLNFFASRQNNAFVDYREFCDYLKRYAEHHIEEQADLVQFLGDPAPALQKELDKLVESKQVLIVSTTPEKQAIIVISFYIQRFSERYKDIVKNPSTPFPVEQDLPKQAPNEILTREQAADFIFSLLNKQEINDKHLYSLVLPHDVPPILFPSKIPVSTLLDISFLKLRTMLHKDEFHDYFLKKLAISNPGKEISVKNFFNSFVQRTDTSSETLKKAGDTFYFWTQLCFFVKQDYEKVKDLTQEDISLLQAISIIEVAVNFYKSKAQEEETRTVAFETLQQMLNKPPYYFTFETIIRFNDSRGIPLLGQYSDKDLKSWLHTKSTESVGNELPLLLVFKTENGQHYFISKSKILALILRLCNDARVTVRNTITNSWFAALRAFKTLPEMKDQKAFERHLELEVKVQSPILYAVLNAPFLPLLSYESESDDYQQDKVTIFADGQLLPYSEMLLMNRQNILSDAKIMLPFWYTIPIISWIAKLLFRKPKTKQKNVKTSAEHYHEEEQRKQQLEKDEAAAVKNPAVSRKVAFHESAREAEAQLVPANSTLNRELEGYRRQWNKLIGKETSNNLTEDVDSLIRDYLRKVLRTISNTGFTVERIQSLSESLVKTPGMQKIKEHDALQMYIQLYIIKLVKNIPM